MNTNTTLKQQLKIHQDNELHKAKIKERLNNLLNYDKFSDYIQKALSLGLSACYNDEDFFATLEPCKSSTNAETFDTYEFNIFCTKEQAEKDKKSYRFHAFISVQSKKLNVEISTFLEDDISESDILNCLIKLVGFEFRTNSATLVELLEQESIEKEARKTFISELSNLINTEEIKKILVEAVKSNKHLVASTILDGYNIILEKRNSSFLFYIAELGNNDMEQEILSTSASIASIQFTLIQNRNTKNVENGDDELCNFVLKDNLTEWFYYIPEKINRNKVLDYLKKVVGTM